MIKVVGNDLWRGGQRVGWIEGDYIKNHDGTRMGYVDGHYVYSADGVKRAYIEGDYLKTMDGHSIRLEDNRTVITGGTVSDLIRGAVRILLGE